MLRSFSNGDWERFLKQSADQMKMRPSDKVWQHISRNLHRRRRRVAVTSAALLLSFLSLGYWLINSAEKISPTVEYRPPQSPTTRVDQVPSLNITQSNSGNTAQLNASAQSKNISSINRINSTTGIPQNSITATGTFLDKQPLTSAITKVDNIEPVTGKIAKYTPSENSPNNNQLPLTTNNESKISGPVADATALTKAIGKKRKWSFQLLFTPTISYRKLSENQLLPGAASLQNGLPFTSSRDYNINNAVTHKPSIGLELGFAAKYAVAKNVKLRSGLQLNISRYGIKAYKHPYEMATIALSNGYHVDSLSSISHLRNFNGTEPNWVQNNYLQVSAPIGVEVKLRGNENMQLGIASTLQPTYVLGNRAYLISTDYKNYTQVPWLIRRWNMAASVETFVAYSTGKINWQVGPQVRYQLFSSYSKKYPVKENLFDFGLKVGVSLNKVQ